MLRINGEVSLIAKEYEDYLNFVSEALELAKKIPRYFSKYSNKIYCNHQKFVIVILMQKLKLTTRGVISFLRSNPSLCLEFGLLRIPVHTTIIRFFLKIKNIIGLLLNIRQAITVAVDATGFELEAKSFYYRTKWNSERKWKTKQYMKLSVAIDTDKQLILDYKIRKKFRHDTLDFKNLLKDLDVKHVVADKGYDSKSNRLFVVRKLKATPNIPYRKFSSKNHLQGKKIIPFDESTYHQRSKVETVFSVIKRKYGSILRNKSYATQQVELISKLIVYNLDRKLNYLLLILRVAPEPLKINFIYFN
ncbi:IS5 family transposase [Candidatus Woesearchaeota archaeon]|nr:IS5 family transposase [Candidatus Woesearchaeota archaeon]